ncbi:MAG: carboxymuconolactone decarboxylase family protein [Peptococcaceae bacterium]|nr:carboxymuconolactone decarboxylase family protein [Peptococcaceae bacterium]
MQAFINPPKRIPFYLKIGIWLTKRVTGKDLLPPKLLAWYPKAALSSGIMEVLVAHGKKDLNERILKLVRIQTSFTVACPFCIDMNSHEFDRVGISDMEISALQGTIAIDSAGTFSEREKLALAYAKHISQSPLSFPSELIAAIKQHFTEREIVILATTAAQVNYWARVLQALGVPPAGFTDNCRL